MRTCSRWFCTTSRQRARAVVKIAATLDTEVFCHRDLHAFDALPIPQRLEKRIGKAEKKQILNGVFAQVVVDAKNVFFPEDAVHHSVQCLRCGKILSERFFDHDARARGTTRLAEPMNDGLEQAGRDGEIVRRPLRVAQFPPQRLKSRRIGIVAVNVVHAAAQAAKSVRVQTAIVLNAVPRACAELVERPAGFGDADNGDVEIAAFGQRLQGGKYFLMGEIPRSAKKYQRVGGRSVWQQCFRS